MQLISKITEIKPEPGFGSLIQRQKTINEHFNTQETKIEGVEVLGVGA